MLDILQQLHAGSNRDSFLFSKVKYILPTQIFRHDLINTLPILCTLRTFLYHLSILMFALLTSNFFAVQEKAIPLSRPMSINYSPH